MRILWIKTELLHPVDKGGRIRTYQMLRALAREHEVTYLTLDDGGAAPDARERAREYCSHLVTVPFAPPARMSSGYMLDLLRNLLSPLPYAISRYRSAALRREVRRLAEDTDLVICDFLAPSQNVPASLPARTVLFQHNVEAMIWERNAEVSQGAVRRAYMREQWRRMRRFEARECRRFAHVVAVSDVDAQVIRTQYGAGSVSSVTTGVDLDYFAPTQPSSVRDCEVLFVGSMDWMPNEDGIAWFVAEVLPLVRRQLPHARLTIVGRSPSETVRQLAGAAPGIEVTGTVPDVRPYLARAAVSIVPLRVGGGTRLKIYEAMAMGAPIVSTTIGAEGLPLQHGTHLLIADTAAAQAAAVISLLQDPPRGGLLSRNARQFVQEHCGWQAVAGQFIQQCVAGHRESNRNTHP